MREILFRGFHPRENGTEGVRIEEKEIKGEWLYGDLIQYPAGTCSIRACVTKDYVCHFFVIPETVGEYIGITHNGKRIFENDIVTIRYSDTAVENAVIEKVGACFCADNWEINNYYDIEVLGNIHDNPELLEGEK